MSFLSLLLTFLGGLLLLASLAGVALGLYMASNRRTRGSGLYFALWWTPAAAAAAGVMMRDPVTFLVGALCFVVAGAALAIERGARRKSGRGGGRKGGSAEDQPVQPEEAGVSRLSERPTKETVRTRIRSGKARREAAS